MLHRKQLATTGKRVYSELGNENIKDGVVLGRAAWVHVWQCFLPRHFHSWVDRRRPFVRPLVWYYTATSEPPNDTQPSSPKKKSILECHWRWAKCCCCWYCSKYCRSSSLLAHYEFVVAMIKAIKFAYAQYRFKHRYIYLVITSY